MKEQKIMGKCGEVWRNVGNGGKMCENTGKCGKLVKTWGSVVKIWKNLGKCGKIGGNVGESENME